MSNNLILHITNDLKSLSSDVLLVENNDGFLFRDDVINYLAKEGVTIVHGSPLKQRVKFELRRNELLLVLLSDNYSNYLEDITQKAYRFEFFLDKYLGSYHIQSIINEDLDLLNQLLNQPQIIALSKQDTIKEIEKIKNARGSKSISITEFEENLKKETEQEPYNWHNILYLISLALTKTIGTNQEELVIKNVQNINELFQNELKKNYASLKSSNAIKSPKIVSKILEHLNSNFKNEKLALIVIDGLSFWQYILLKDKIEGLKKEQHIYSWLPSITQLSRQAIFKGDIPDFNYKQNPKNEERLWKLYWKDKGFNDFEIRYNHETIDLSNLTAIKRFAIVFKDLDDFMHSSKDFTYLLKSTENWIERSQTVEVINQLTKQGFKVFITSDHGNIQAKGWRSLNGKEKLGTNKSGSRSERHVEYSENWLLDELLENNPELKDAVIIDDQSIYFKNDQSFSYKDSLVTHGGAHIFEVLIPFIEISNEE